MRGCCRLPRKPCACQPREDRPESRAAHTDTDKAPGPCHRARTSPERPSRRRRAPRPSSARRGRTCGGRARCRASCTTWASCRSTRELESRRSRRNQPPPQIRVPSPPRSGIPSFRRETATRLPCRTQRTSQQTTTTHVTSFSYHTLHITYFACFTQACAGSIDEMSPRPCAPAIVQR